MVPVSLCHTTQSYHCDLCEKLFARSSPISGPGYTEEHSLVSEGTKLFLYHKYCIWWGLLKERKTNFKIMRQYEFHYLGANYVRVIIQMKRERNGHLNLNEKVLMRDRVRRYNPSL